ncbi:hypothetical protein H4684_003793 [Desulfomicrobium macestii]|uniref:Uncharacterized protein n=1 Tax=Desulfomicrobium macestii TaxID=90731 RepID=A0ABR9H8T2_9BACT|nr:hypothetical protein [Desulfomicrobium macestii]MBE1427105.1 hypothetical protein [Desulfomicrobium macestii]
MSAPKASGCKGGRTSVKDTMADLGSPDRAGTGPCESSADGSGARRTWTRQTLNAPLPASSLTRSYAGESTSPGASK